MAVKRAYNPGLYRWSILPAFCTLPLVALHKAIGTIYHIAWAPVATGVILWISLRILLHYAHNRELRLASLTLVRIVFCQVFLGMATT